jgi:condensin-2 complex subunit H2
MARGNLRILSERSDIDHSGILHLPGTASFGGITSNSQRFSNVQVVSGEGNTEANNAFAPDQLTNQDDGADFIGDVGGDDHDNDGDAFMMAGDDEPQPEQPKPVAPPKPSKADPWILLDPHDPETKKGRPIRIGVTYRLPTGLEEPPSQCVTGARTRRKPVRRLVEQVSPQETICIATATFKATMANERRRRERLSLSKDHSELFSIMSNEPSEEHVAIELPSVPIKGLVFGNEFAYIAKAAAKRKAAERRERRKLLQADPSAVSAKEADNLLGYDDADDYGDGFDMGGDDDSYHEDTNQAVMGNTGIASLDDAFSVGDTSNPEGAKFEALCRAHIRAFAKGAEKYAAETNLTKRVGEWQSKLAPILEEEEHRPVFDIHVYGQRVIDVVQGEIDKKKRTSKIQRGKQSIDVVSFETVTNHCEHFEVCRLFLASLSLSNSGNVQLIGEEGGKVSTPDSLRIELLDACIDHPMETYLAPSAQQGVSVQ